MLTVEQLREKCEKYLDFKTVAATITTVLGFHYLYSKYKKYSLEQQRQEILSKQSIQRDSKEKNRGKIHRHHLAINGAMKESIYEHVPYTETLYESFMNSVKNYPDCNCLGSRKDEGPYTWLSYKEVEEVSTNFGSGLLKLGLAPQDFVGIFSPNNIEWVISDRGLIMYSMVSIPLYQTLGKEAVQHIIKICELKTIIATEQHIPIILESHQNYVKTIIVIGGISNDLEKQLNDQKIEIHKFESVISLGKENKSPHVPPKPTDYATISFTSGTTGTPKGAILTHAQLTVAAVTLQLKLNFGEEVHLSYLPLAHVMERILQTVIFHFAGAIGFFRGDPLKLLDDVMELKPTIFTSVPRVYNKVYDGVLAKISEAGGLNKKLFDYAFEVKKASLSEGQPCTHWLWDRIIFNKIKARLGGRVKILVTGSAPISKEVMTFLRVCFSCIVIEGYGQTETSALGTVTLETDTSTSHVGPPTLSNEICLEDVPEMNYYHTDDPPRGEILIKTYYPFLGYYKEPEITKETVTEDGWVHTGDIGCWLPNGTLKIIDRKKNIFKLSQGEYIAPEKIENIMIQAPSVQAVWVTGSSLHNYVVAFLVPNPNSILKFGKDTKKGDDLKALCQDKDVIEFVLKEMEMIGTAKGLNKLEIPKKIFLEPNMWTPESQLLTPTMKTKRNEMTNHYKSEIEKLYQ